MEKYGTMPPRFTKAWWEHYWIYYKLHFIIGAFLLFGIGQLVMAVISNVNYDLKIQYLTSSYDIPEEGLKLLDEKTAELSVDVTKNKKVETKTVTMTLPPFEDYSRVQELQAVQTRMIADLQMADNQIYIVDKTVADILYSYECMMDVTEWAGDVSSDLIYSDIAFSLADTQSFKQMGIDTSDLYMCVLCPTEDNLKDKECAKKFENAENVAKQLIEE